MLSQISSTSRMRCATLSWSMPKDLRVCDIHYPPGSCGRWFPSRAGFEAFLQPPSATGSVRSSLLALTVHAAGRIPHLLLRRDRFGLAGQDTFERAALEDGVAAAATG